MRASKRARWFVVATAGAALFGCDNKTPEPPAATASQALNAPTGPQAAGSVHPQPDKPEASNLSAADPCAAVCERSRELSCNKRESCPALCREMLEDAACRTELVNALRCFAEKPAANWECGEDGLASIREGFCDAEQGHFAACVEKTAEVR